MYNGDKREFVTSATLEAVFIFLYRLQVKYENRCVETLVSQATEKKDCVSLQIFGVSLFLKGFVVREFAQLKWLWTWDM